MLFDLRGRQPTPRVRVIYIGLALLMGVGLVGFGVGGGVGGGGLLNAASNNEGSSGVSFASQIKKYEKLTKQQPGNASAWENLTRPSCTKRAAKRTSRARAWSRARAGNCTRRRRTRGTAISR